MSSGCNSAVVASTPGGGATNESCTELDQRIKTTPTEELHELLRPITTYPNYVPVERFCREADSFLMCSRDLATGAGIALDDSAEPDVAQLVCPLCGGDGGWGPEHEGQSWLECRACEGTGWVDGEPIEEDDLW